MTTHTHSFASWPFADPINTVTYCTAKVAHERLPVLQVAHDWDGDWPFLDATTEEPGECVLLCLGCVIERDATLVEISNLPRGHGAFRPFVGAPWERWEKPRHFPGYVGHGSVGSRSQRLVQELVTIIGRLRQPRTD